jgi:hypothetical protein
MCASFRWISLSHGAFLPCFDYGSIAVLFSNLTMCG